MTQLYIIKVALQFLFAIIYVLLMVVIRPLLVFVNTQRIITKNVPQAHGYRCSTLLGSILEYRYLYFTTGKTCENK
jgi:hypothetical protein